VTDPERDDEFEAYLRRRSALLTHARSEENLEPPDNLDDIVLKTARQAIQSPEGLPLYKAPRWALPVALAATLLLCVSIAVNVSLNSRKANTLAAPAAAPKGDVILPEVVAPHRDDAPPVVAERVAPGAPAPPASTSSAHPTDASQPAPPTSPQTWMARINALRAAGKTAQADAELRRFRATFPGYRADGPSPPPSEQPK
jgi:hypothetical protein